jgi:hypothetical protein
MAKLIVENLCKTLRKTSCISKVKNRVKLFIVHLVSVKLHFPTNFFNLSHYLFHRLPTSVFQLFYPLFHRPYNNNYKIINRKDYK